MKVRLIGALLIVAALVLGSDSLFAQNLGSGRSPTISIGWIAIMLFLCLGIAVFVIFWIKFRHDHGAISIRKWRLLSGRERSHDAFQIVETRRAGSQSDVTLIRWRGREFLLAISAGQLLLLGERQDKMESIAQEEER